MKFDAIIIGTGQAGPSLAARLASEGLKTAVIEKHFFGGTCVNDGCTPTKTYVASARRAHLARNSTALGVTTNKVSVDLKTIKARKDEMVLASRNGLKNWMENTENITTFLGHGRFTGPNSVEVNKQTLTAGRIFINVGGRTRMPGGYEGVDVLNNTSILQLEEIPEHLIIVGGGYIGLEFAQTFRRFGAKVTLIERGERLLKREDEDVSLAIQELFEKEGIALRLQANCLKGHMEGEEVVVDVDCKLDGTPQVRGSHLLLAVGREPNTNDLGLEAAGVRVNGRGFIEVNDALQTNVPHIYAMGDCNGQGAFTHTAYNDFQIVASQLFEEKKRSLKDRHLCYACYIDPTLGRVGMNESEAKAKGIKALKAFRPMSRIARAKEMGETDGFLKIIVDAESERILGASFLGVHADEIVQSILTHMYTGASYTTIRDGIHIHPTITELIPTMLETLEEI